MNQHSGHTLSAWRGPTEPSPLASLTQDLACDVCIVGAGISGLSTAYLLAKEGKQVVVLDDGPIGAGETERTTAHLSNALDDRYEFLARKHGPEGARLAAESHTAAIAMIERITQDESISCDFQRLDGYLFVPDGVSPDELRKEFAAARQAGLNEVQLVERAPYPLFQTTPVLRFPAQAEFHPLKYLNGLVQAVQQLGGRIYCNTHAEDFGEGKPATVKTSDGRKVACGSVVVATNSPVNDHYAIHTKQAPYRTYALGLRIPAGAVPRALYWDTAQDAKEAKSGHLAAYHYVRLQAMEEAGQDLLIVGGEDHKTAHADDAEERWANLERWTRDRFPMAGAVAYRWSGQVMEPVDGMAFIGRNPGQNQENVYIATGDSGHGMTHGTIAGILITDLIQGRDNPWAEVYDPARKVGKSLGEFAKENIDVALKYAELLTAGDLKSLDPLPKESGAIVSRGASKLAVYRDASGEFHQFSAICPHLRCVVHWNHAERSWDCPCHGSRFSSLGEVINGPALSNLEPIAPEHQIH